MDCIDGGVGGQLVDFIVAVEHRMFLKCMSAQLQCELVQFLSGDGWRNETPHTMRQSNELLVGGEIAD